MSIFDSKSTYLLFTSNMDEMIIFKNCCWTIKDHFYKNKYRKYYYSCLLVCLLAVIWFFSQMFTSLTSRRMSPWSSWSHLLNLRLNLKFSCCWVHTDQWTNHLRWSDLKIRHINHFSAFHHHRNILTYEITDSFTPI